MNTLVLGAGDTGRLVASKAASMKSFTIVGFVDDDPAKQGTSIAGFPVVCNTDSLLDKVKELSVRVVLFAIPSASGALVDKVTRVCASTAVELKTVPAFFSLLCGAGVEDVRPLAISDIFHRPQRVQDVTQTFEAEVFAGKTALVTGAGGSIGAILCRQLLRSTITKLICLGRGENSIFELMKIIGGDKRVTAVIADVRDEHRMRTVMEKYRPQLVFHAAAHKHVSLMESSVEEAVLNNVWGTLNVVTASERIGAERCVVISTDKAVYPSCIMGVTKRVAELVTLSKNGRRDGKSATTCFSVVRFGNVLGSRGSVVPIFEERISRNQPLRITHPDVQRYFISIEEACFLVLEACRNGVKTGGGLFVLDMGAPIKIIDIARKLLLMRNKSVDQYPIEFVGLQKGEKMDEDLFYKFESPQKSSESVFACKSPVADLDLDSLDVKISTLIRAAQRGETDKCISLLKNVVPDFVSSDGTPINGDLPLSVLSPWPFFGDDEVSKAADVIRSGQVNYWTGKEGVTFEKEFAAFVGTKFAIAVANGTVALELALKTLGIGAGDEVVVPARTYIASASCAAVCGARPIVADVDMQFGLITRETIEAVLTPKTKAVVVVHIGGWPCDMDPIMALAKEKGLFIVEDCAQSHLAMYKGRQVGTFGHINAFSFCQDKIMTTAGEGGMLVTDNEQWWKKAWAYKDIGRDYDAVFNAQHPPGFRWLTHSFGTNWRLSEVQSAIGRIQLTKLRSWVDRRRHNAQILQKGLADAPGISLIHVPDHIEPSFYKYYCTLDLTVLPAGWTRDKIVTELNTMGVQAFSGSCCEIYREKAFPDEWKPSGRLPGAAWLADRSLMLLVHPTLSPETVASTAEKVTALMKKLNSSRL